MPTTTVHRGAPRASVPKAAVPSTPPAGGLRRGSQGPAVERLQATLQRLGYLAGAERAAERGHFGPATERGVARFKAEHGLREVGRYGDKAATALSGAAQGAPTPSSAGPSRVKTVDAGDLQDLTWARAAQLIRESGGTVCPGGQPSVLAVRTRNAGTAAYADVFVVLKPDGRMKAFAATTRPTVTYDYGGWEPCMVVPGNYRLVPRWRDGKFNDDAFIIGSTRGGMTVPVARDLNGDGRYSKSEIASAIPSDEIRLHRGNATTTSSAGCFNVQDYDAFLRYVGGRDASFGLTVVEDRRR